MGDDDRGPGPSVRRVAVVTGGGSGVGRAIAQHLGRAGHAVAVLDLDGDAASSVAAELRAGGVDATGCRVDVGTRAEVEAAYQHVRSVLGPVDMLVTSAAVASFARFQDVTADQWDHTLRVNLTGTFHCIQAAIGDMADRGWGRVVTISSAAGQTASPRQAHYSASKGGVIAMTRTLAAEFARKGVTVNSVAPSIVETPMLRDAQDAGEIPPTDVLAAMVPAGRLGTVDDIAAVCAFLCSDDAAYLTGQVIAPNGGAVI